VLGGQSFQGNQGLLCHAAAALLVHKRGRALIGHRGVDFRPGHGSEQEPSQWVLRTNRSVHLNIQALVARPVTMNTILTGHPGIASLFALRRKLVATRA